MITTVILGKKIKVRGRSDKYLAFKRNKNFEI